MWPEGVSELCNISSPPPPPNPHTKTFFGGGGGYKQTYTFFKKFQKQSRTFLALSTFSPVLFHVFFSLFFGASRVSQIIFDISFRHFIVFLFCIFFGRAKMCWPRHLRCSPLCIFFGVDWI